MSMHPWWRGAIIYQIYPRSFHDANNDGIGDLKGICDKLDYVASLGVDAIWVSPFFTSPMRDFGYDIADYRNVDPIFGTIDDFDELIRQAHARGLKVMIDQVLSHTSDQHAWFQESRQSRDNPKADWYVWADPKEDGSEPTNWVAVFGGSAWQFDETRGQYYMHNFLTSQPDLNYHSKSLRAAMLEEVRFWLDKGVDGFRFDAINYCFHDQQLRDNPFKPVEERKGRGFSENNPYAAQYHLYDNNQPEMLAFLQELRQVLDEYDDIGTVGEINTEDSLKSISEYTSEQRLHLGYSFELLADEGSTDHIRTTVSALEAHLKDGAMGCWAISNHDVKRVVSRWGRNGANPPLAKMLTVMVASLRGTICTYQGEELGLTEAEIAFDQLQDPFGIQFWPEFKGRDGCRTPMPWSADTPNGAFSETTPWLPIPEEHYPMAVDRQEADPNSVLNNYRHFIKWRKTQLALRYGDLAFVYSDEHVLGFTRSYQGQTLLCLFNFSGEPQNIAMNLALTPVSDLKQPEFELRDNEIALAPYAFFFAVMKTAS